MILTEEEKKFIEYWEANRLRKKKVLKQLSLGLPLATVIVLAVVANFLSGWYKKADIEIRKYPSSIIVVVVAVILIVVFIAIFSVRHQWDINEQHYRELLAKRDAS